jgi:hypothetical protein
MQPEPFQSLRQVFVGRSREWDELRAGVEDLESGQGRLFILTGEPGIGKTRLADETALYARAKNIRVIFGRTWEAGGTPAFWPWIQVFRACVKQGADPQEVAILKSGAPEIGRLIANDGGSVVGTKARSNEVVPPPSAGEPAEQRFGLFDSAASFIKRQADNHPTMIVLDDCHAADLDSLLFLRFLARDLRQTPLLLVVTYREVELRLSPAKAQLMGELSRDGMILNLQGLSEDDVRKFIERSAKQTPTPVLVTALHQTTEGNPLFLSELVRLLISEGRISEGADGTVGALRIPDEVRAAIRLRLGLVSDTACEVLRLASVLGHDFDLRTLGLVSPLPESALIEALDESVHNGLIKARPDSIGFYHFSHLLIGETLYNDLPNGRRQEVHRTIAEAIERASSDDLEQNLSELAHHWVQTLPGGEVEKAVDYARRAAERALKLVAYDEAAKLYRMALSAARLRRSPNRRSECELQIALGEALYKAGLTKESRETLTAASDVAKRIGSPELFARAVLGIAVTPSDPGTLNRPMVALLEEALGGLAPEDSSIKAMIMSRLAWELFWADDSSRRTELGGAAVEMARRLSDGPTLVYALVHRHLALWGPDNLEQHLETADEIVALCDSSENRIWAPRAHHFRLFDLLTLGDVRAADLEIDEYSRLAEKFWLPLAFKERALATRALMEGRFADSERLAGQAHSAAMQILPLRARYAYEGLLFALRREQGRLTEIESACRDLVAQYPSVVLSRSCLANSLVENGKTSEARAEFELIASSNFTSVPRHQTWLPTMVLLAEVCARLGDVERAPLIFSMLEPYASRNALIDLNACFGPVALYLGVLATAMSRFDEAHANFQLARQMCEKMGAWPFLSRTQCEFATMLVKRNRPGDRATAAEMAASALEIADRLGMAALVKRLRALGVVPVVAAGLNGVVAASFAPPPDATAILREGDFWRLSFAGKTTLLGHSRGFSYLAFLLGNPGREYAAILLASATEDTKGHLRFSAEPEHPDSAANDADAKAFNLGDAGEMLDPKAKTEYRTRRREAREELEEARRFNDFGRIERLEQELEFLDDEMSRAIGIGDRNRRSSSHSERARISVGKLIRHALSRIDPTNPELGRHLATTIRTGAFCSYKPDPRVPIAWKV